jgi:hypothetical protein
MVFMVLHRLSRQMLGSVLTETTAVVSQVLFTFHQYDHPLISSTVDRALLNNLIVVNLNLVIPSTAERYLIFQESMCHVRFYVLKVASMKMTVFCDVTPCCLVEVHQCFRGAYCLCQGMNYHRDDDGSKHLWNVSKTSTRLHGATSEDSHLLTCNVLLASHKNSVQLVNLLVCLKIPQNNSNNLNKLICLIKVFANSNEPVTNKH